MTAFRCFAAMAGVMVAIAILSAAAAQTTTPRVLEPAEKRQWIAALTSAKTADGATILEVLRYAEKMRPREFKLGPIDIGYDGAGNADAVVVRYWVGQKRLRDDAFSLSFRVEQKAGGLAVDPDQDDIAEALERGRDSFVERVDQAYELVDRI